MRQLLRSRASTRVLVSMCATIGLVSGITLWLAAAPNVGVTQATPSEIAVNTPTLVTVTSAITDSTVIATGVNLLETDAGGRTLAVLGTMRDDGTGGP